MFAYLVVTPRPDLPFDEKQALTRPRMMVFSPQTGCFRDAEWLSEMNVSISGWHRKQTNYQNQIPRNVFSSSSSEELVIRARYGMLMVVETIRDMCVAERTDGKFARVTVLIPVEGYQCTNRPSCSFVTNEWLTTFSDFNHVKKVSCVEQNIRVHNCLALWRKKVGLKMSELFAI